MLLHDVVTGVAASDPVYRVALADAVLEGATEAVLSVDDEGIVRGCNRSAERMFGWQAVELVGRSIHTLTPPVEQRRRGDSGPGGARPDGPGRAVGVRRDGSRFPMELIVTPFTVAGRRHATWLVRDVTDRAHLEAQLRQSQKMDAMGQLAGGVAHDFNNLLTVIGGWCEALGSDALEDRRCAVEEIARAASRAATLTAQLLAFSRKADISPRVVDLNAVVREVATMLSRVIGEQIQLDLRLDARAASVRVDTGQMGQVLLNLAVNARDAMPKGGRLTIATGTSPSEAQSRRSDGEVPGPHVWLRVSDTGTGMSAEVAARVFEPFFTTKGEKGTGLGLATVYGIVRQAGGSISVDTAPGAGATFVILLPAVAAEAETTEVVPPQGRERGDETILLVEDEAQVRAIAVSMLRSRGYRVLPASTVDEAVQLAEAHPALDAVVSDVIMPGQSGPELVARLRQMHPSVPVLYVSGYAAEAVLETTERREAFLQKPYTGRQLALVVRELLDRPKTQTHPTSERVEG